MNKKWIIWGLVIIAVLIIGRLLVSCGQQLAVTTTDSYSLTGQSVATITTLAEGMGQLAGSLSKVGSQESKMGGSAIGGLAVKALPADQPPAAFFTTQSSTWDGWIDVSDKALRPGETVRIRMLTLGEDIIDGALLQGKKIAVLGDFDWSNMVKKGTVPSQSQMQSFITTFANPSTRTDAFTSIDSLWGYVVWSEIGPSFTSYLKSRNDSNIPSNIYLSTPEATTCDQEGSFQVRVTKSNGERIDISMTVTLEYNVTVGHPVPKTMSESGFIVRRDGVIMTLEAMSITLDSTTGNPSSGTLQLKTSDGYTISMTMNSDGSQDGTVTLTASGASAGTIHVNANGSGYFIDADGNRHEFGAPS